MAALVNLTFENRTIIRYLTALFFCRPINHGRLIPDCIQ